MSNNTAPIRRNEYLQTVPIIVGTPANRVQPSPGTLRAVLLVTGRFAPPALDTAVSAALLEHVASGGGPVLRVWVPDRAVAFGRQDSVRPGYARAVAAVAERGFAPIERLAGGRAAVFHEATVAFSWALASDDPRTTIGERFQMVSDIVITALQELGADARLGEVPGEYCPGSWSVNLAGTHKVMGVGQRLIRGAAHLGGVIVVDGADLVNEALLPAYEALGYTWRPEATGALARMVPGVSPVDVAASFVAAAGAAGHPSHTGSLAPEVLARAEALAPDHQPIA